MIINFLIIIQEKMNNLSEKIKEKGMIYYLLVAQVVFLLVLPAMDGKINTFRIFLYFVFAITSVAIVVLAVIECFKNRKAFDKVFIIVMTFFLMCTISAIWAMIRNVPFADVVRGIAPFVWYIYIIVIVVGVRLEETEKLNRAVGMIALMYSARIYVYYFLYVAGEEGERVTFHLYKATSIVPMIGVLIFCYYFLKYENAKMRYIVALLFCYISVILTQTKSMLIAVLIGVFLVLAGTGMCAKKKICAESEMKKRYILIIGVIFVSTTILMFTTSLGNRWKSMVSVNQPSEMISSEMISSEIELSETTSSEMNSTETEVNKDSDKPQIVVEKGSVSVRIVELKTAIKHFINTPILGEGIGYRWVAEGVDYGKPVIYMHNVVAFCMLDFGIMGLVYLFVVVLIFFKMEYKVIKANVDLELKKSFQFSLAVIIMAFAYANFFAVYRSIEFVVLCSIYIGKIILEYRRIINGDLK